MRGRNCKNCRYSFYKDGRLLCVEYGDDFCGSYRPREDEGKTCYRYVKRWSFHANRTFVNANNYEVYILPLLFVYLDNESFNVGFNFLFFAIGLTIYKRQKGGNNE